jgi:hypothetical protein
MPARIHGAATRFEHGASPHTELAIEQWRVVEDEPALAAWRSALVDERDVVLFQQSLRELARIGDGRGRADERRTRAVELAHSLEAADHVGDLAAEQSAIRVQLVDDDELQAGEKAPPPRVMRQHAGVQHVGVGHHDVPRLADGRAAPGGGVAVVRVDSQVDGQAALQRPELRQLVLGQGLRGKEIDGPPLRIFEQALQDRQVVAEGLAAGGRGNHRQVATVSYCGISLGLVGVESGDPAGFEG